MYTLSIVGHKAKEYIVKLLAKAKELINPIYGYGAKITPFLNSLCGWIGRPCPDVSKKV